MIVHEEMYEVRLSGWHKGALKVSAVEIIREHTNIGLAQAKGAVDRTLESGVTIFTFDSLTPAARFSDALNKIGFLSEVIKSDSGKVVPAP